MAVTNTDTLINAMGNDRQKFPVYQTGLTAQRTLCSCWRTTGFPPQANIPTAAEVCTTATRGAVPYEAPGAGQATYIGRASLSTMGTYSAELHDRLAQMGGLGGAVTTAQTVGIDLSAMAATGNLAARKEAANYSAVQWWVELYSPWAASNSTLTVNYVDHLGTAATTTVTIPLSAGAGVMLPIHVTTGTYIRAVTSVTLGATVTGTMNFGVTATIGRMEIDPENQLNVARSLDWMALSLPQVHDQSCLFYVMLTTTTAPAGVNGAITLIQG